MDVAQHRLHADLAGEVSKEHHQTQHAHDAQRKGDRDRHPWDERGLTVVAAVDRPQHRQRIRERRQEDGQGDLYEDVAGEGSQQSRRELATRELKRDDGQGERQ